MGSKRLSTRALGADGGSFSADAPRRHRSRRARGVEREASLRVAPPRVARSPVALECELHATLTAGVGTVVMGRVVHAAIDENVLVEGRPAIERLAPLARLGANEWTTLGEIREITRIGYREWPGHYRGPGRVSPE
ncbi:MAG: flavin reductase [Solirubrobacteraceae bacterium]